jgi:hypothetical protein
MQALSDAHFRLNKPAPKFILNVLCTAFAYFSIHIHAKWPTLIEDVAQIFQADIDRAFVLLSTLKYMADDCDNESIVIEDSIRDSYFGFLDSRARVSVFQSIFDHWAKNISLVDDVKKASQLKGALMETFLAWIKLRLPDEVFKNLVVECPNLLALVFQQMADAQDDENL